MAKFQFKCPATETQRGHAYFEVEAATEEEARAKLVEESAEYYIDFTEEDGGTEWHAEKPEDWARI
jgi:DNA-dependent RNA polymerase auxiliary subunit epsilon